MDWGLEWLKQAGAGIAAAFMQPFGYAAVLVVVLLALRQIGAERKLFHVRLTAWPGRLLAALPAGLAAGAVVSTATMFLGLRLNADAVWWLWGASLLAGLLRLRFMAVVYGAGFVALLQWGAGLLNWTGAPDIVRRLAASLESFDAAGLLLLAGLLMIAEAVLLAWFSRRLSGPVIVDGKRGRPIGGWRLDAVWPVPLLVLVPSADASAAAAALPWTPLFGLDAGWAMLGMPVLIGSVWRTTSMLPRMKAARTARQLIWAGPAAAAVGAAAAYWELLLPAAAVIVPALRELARFIERRRESEGRPLFVHDSGGLRVLAVQPGSSGAQLGIEPGEIVHKVNGVAVRTAEDLYNGLASNPAYCRIELLNLDGHVRFAQRARYENEHHQLGLVLAPDENMALTVSGLSRSLLGLLPGSPVVRRRGDASLRAGEPDGGARAGIPAAAGSSVAGADGEPAAAGDGASSPSAEGSGGSSSAAAGSDASS